MNRSSARQAMTRSLLDKTGTYTDMLLHNCVHRLMPFQYQQGPSEVRRLPGFRTRASSILQGTTRCRQASESRTCTGLLEQLVGVTSSCDGEAENRRRTESCQGPGERWRPLSCWGARIDSAAARD